MYPRMLTTAPITQPMAKNTAPMAVSTARPWTCSATAPAASARSVRSSWIRSGSGAGRSLKVVITFFRSGVG